MLREERELCLREIHSRVLCVTRHLLAANNLSLTMKVSNKRKSWFSRSHFCASFYYSAVRTLLSTSIAFPDAKQPVCLDWILYATAFWQKLSLPTNTHTHTTLSEKPLFCILKVLKIWYLHTIFLTAFTKFLFET